MLHIKPATIQCAFECYVEHYARATSRAWSIAHQMELYTMAERAFTGKGSFDHFNSIYTALQKWWKVFRNAKAKWDAETTFKALMQFDTSLRFRKLSEITKEDWPKIWDYIQGIKMSRGGQNRPVRGG